MGFRTPSLIIGATVVALVLASLSGVRTEAEEGEESFKEDLINWEETLEDLPCFCDLPNCAPLAECHRLLHESVDKVVRYVDCPGRNVDCCCKNPDPSATPDTDKITAYLLSRKSQESSAANVNATQTPKKNLLKNNSSESIADSYIKDPINSLEGNSSEETFPSSQPGQPKILSDRPEAPPSVEAFETTFPPATEPTPKPGASEHSTTEAVGSLRIVGGSYDPLKNDNWTVHITLFDYTEHKYYQCTGSLISPRHVLTASHCRYDSQGKHRLLFRVSFGLQDKNRMKPLFALEGSDITFIEHPNFASTKALMNDIALIRTSIPVSTSGVIKAIKLLPNTYTTSGLVNTWVRVTGWGGTYPGSASDYLLQTDMQITDKVCVQNLSRFNPEAQLCVMGVNSDICDGDSGSPLTVYLQGKVYLVGLITAGSVDCSGTRPAVAVFVGFHRAWIERTIAEVEPNYLNYVQFT